MKKLIKISIIIPVYNVEKYISQCLDSVFSQTLQEIEVICVDDGSVDNSLNIIKEYSMKEKRLRILSQKNQGAGIARNNGLNCAIGEYVAFMDSDDFYPNEFVLEELYEKAVQNGVLIIGGGLIEVYSDDRCRTKYENNDGRVFEKEGIVKFYDYQYDYYYQRFIYKRDFLNINNIRFPIYRRHQDVVFFVRAMVSAKRFYALNIYTYCYRVGHKVVAWNKEIANDVILAIKDVLLICNQYDLKKLHNRLFTRLIIQYFDNILSVLEFTTVRKTLYEIFSLYKNSQLHKKDFENNITIFLNACSFHKRLESSKKLEILKVYDMRKVVQPKVSIVVPVFNVEKYLKECLESIINQSLKEIEIICVNDGSTDSSLKILKEYFERDSRVVIVSQPNKGLSVARNVGAELSRGQYIYFCDSDDYIDKFTLENLYLKAIDDSLDVLYFDAESFFENLDDEKFKSDFGEYYTRKNIYQGVHLGRELFVQMMKNNEYRTSVCLSFIKKDFYEKAMLKFVPGILHEDNIFSLKCILAANRVSHVSEKYYKRRIRNMSIMTVPKTFANVYGFFTSVLTIMRNKDFQNYEFTEKVYISKIMKDMLNSAVSIFSELESCQKELYKTLNPIEKELFELLIVQNCLLKKEYAVYFIIKKIKEYYDNNGLIKTISKILDKLKMIIKGVWKI